MINYNRLGYEIKRDLANFSEKISNGLKRPQSKFLLQMIYGILAGNKLHLSEIARSLNENITLKKTIDRLSRNLSAFKEKETVMKNYISEVKKQINEENAVIIIDNSDITKPCSPKMEAISDVHDGSTGEIRKGYFTVETAVLSQNEKMQNIMDVAGNYKGNYRMDFKDKHGKKIECKISYIPVQLCEFPNKTLVLVAVYGFGAQPMLLLTNLDLSEKKKLCMIATKVYLMRWRIEEYFKFKKQQFELEDLRVMSLQSIRNLNLFATLVTGYIGIMSCEKDDTIFMQELKECSKRIFDVPKFIFYGLGYAIERVLARTHSGIKGFLLKKEQSQQLTLTECFAELGFK